MTQIEEQAEAIVGKYDKILPLMSTDTYAIQCAITEVEAIIQVVSRHKWLRYQQILEHLKQM